MGQRSSTVVTVSGKNELSFASKHIYNHVDVIVPKNECAIRDDAFAKSDRVRSVTFPESVHSIGHHAFYGCTSLKSPSLPPFLEIIHSSAFQSCPQFESMQLPDSIMSIGNYAFKNCSTLKSINIPASLTSLNQGIFCECTSLSAIRLNEGILEIQAFAFQRCLALTYLELPETLGFIGSFAFSDCGNLRTIEFKSLSATEHTLQPHALSAQDSANSQRNMEPQQEKQHCTPLPQRKSLSQINHIHRHAFSGCRCLTTVNLSQSTFIHIGSNAFANCHHLTNILLPKSTQSIGKLAFADCRTLRSIDIPQRVTFIGEGAFSNCHGLRLIELPHSVTQIDNDAFKNCESLTTVELSESLTRISSGMFSGCILLTSILIPDSVVSVETLAFDRCHRLSTVSLSNSKQRIEKFAFKQCTELICIDLPTVITPSDIHPLAFQDCSKLRNVAGSHTFVQEFRQNRALHSMFPHPPVIGNPVSRLALLRLRYWQLSKHKSYSTSRKRFAFTIMLIAQRQRSTTHKRTRANGKKSVGTRIVADVFDITDNGDERLDCHPLPTEIWIMILNCLSPRDMGPLYS